MDNLKEDILTLGNEVNKILDWGFALDHEISNSIRQVSTWKDKFDKLQEKTRQVKEISDLHGLDETLYMTINTLLLTLKSDIEFAVSNIEYEDGPEGRCLFTNDQSKTANVILPKFTGDLAEDFTEFRMEVEKALRQNRVTRATPLLR